MSLSQKYSGKILTPWFDVAEWKKTKDLIYEESEESLNIALNRLKIWKLRTPLLSAGIEGTLILLEALNGKQRNLTDYEIAQIFSTALLRFLNICAACNDRQGTFYKTAEKNNLPYWLITLRHDIAHDHRVPSRQLLESAMKECLKWVKQKYWDVQEDNMKDYIVSDETNFKDFIKQFVQLKYMHYYKRNTKSIISKIKNEMEQCLPNVNDEYSPKEFIEIVENYITTCDTKDSGTDIVAALTENEIILSVICSSTGGNKKIPSKFRNIWINILSVLYQNGSLFILINKLVDITQSIYYGNSTKEVASLWIAELYTALLKTKILKVELEALEQADPKNLDSKKIRVVLNTICQKHSEFADAITFKQTNLLPFEASRLFQEQILKDPNQYTLTYLELVLKFNNKNNKFIKEQVKNVKNLVVFNPASCTDPQKIYTLRDVMELNIGNNSEGNAETVEPKIQDNVDNDGEPQRKFRKLTKAEMCCFKSYPLGMMPTITFNLF